MTTPNPDPASAPAALAPTRPATASASPRHPNARPDGAKPATGGHGAAWGWCRSHAALGLGRLDRMVCAELAPPSGDPDRRRQLRLLPEELQRETGGAS